MRRHVFQLTASPLPYISSHEFFRHILFLLIRHYTPLFERLTEQLKHPTPKPSSLIPISRTSLSPRSPVVQKWTPCARERPLCSPRYDGFLILLYESAYTLCILPKSTLRGSERPWTASVPSNDDPRDNIFVGVDTICNSHSEGVSMNALDHGHRTHDRDFSVPSALPSIAHAPIVVPHTERRESPDQRKQLYKTGKNPTAVSESSRSSRRPGRERGAPPGRYRCNICGLN